MRKHQIVWIGALIVLVALGAWFYMRQRTAPPAPYVKQVALPVAEAKKLPPSLHPLIYLLILGVNPDVQRAAVLPNPSEGPVSLVVYSVATSLPVLREEFKDYFANTRWRIAEVDRGEQYSLFAERTPERVTVILVPTGSGTAVTLSYIGPTPQP